MQLGDLEGNRGVDNGSADFLADIDTNKTEKKNQDLTGMQIKTQ